MEDVGTLRRTLVANCASLTRLAKDYGSAYLYDLDAIRRNAKGLQTAFGEIQVYYSVKANPLQEVVRTVCQEISGVEVASGGELQYVTQLGVRPDRIVFVGPAKTAKEIESAIRMQIRAMHVESLEELKLAAAAKANVKSETLLAIRVSPVGNEYTPEDRDPRGLSRFGFDEESLYAMRHTGLLHEVQGLHLYSRSQIRRWEVLAQDFERAISLAEHIAEFNDGRFGYVNLGGGFGVSGRPGEPELELNHLAAWLQRRLRRTTLPSWTEVALELGRYLTGPFGILVTSVRAIKESHGTQFVLADCGYNGFLLPLLTGAMHQIVPLGEPTIGSNGQPAQALVGGPLCVPIDILGQIAGWTASVGDPIAILNAGAYGWSMSPQLFLGQPTIAEAVIEDQRLRVVRQRVEPTQYMNLGRGERPTT